MIRPRLPLLLALATCCATARASAGDTVAAGGLMQITLSLLLVVAVLIGISVLFKKFGLNRINNGAFPVKVIGAMAISNNQRLMMIEVGDQWLLLGITPQNITTLTTMPRQENSGSAGSAGSPDKTNFSTWMQSALEKYHAKKP